MPAISLKNAAACLRFNIANNIPTFIWGPPGVGKSQVVHQVLKELKYNIIDIRLSLRDPVDLRGLPLQDVKGGSTKWLPPAELPNVARDGDKGGLFLDEANTASLAMQSAAMGLVLDRKLGEYHLPDGWVPIAAGNRLIDKAAAQRMGTALKNRFSHLEIGVDLDSWCEHANKAEFHPMVVGFIRFRPDLLHIMPGTGVKGSTSIPAEANAFPTPRAWEVVCKYADASEAIRQTLVASVVGEGPAAEFEGFARVWARLPSINEIFTSPKSARVPPMDEPSVHFAVAAAVARRCNKDNFDNALIYAARLTKEFEVMIAVDAVKRDPALQKTRAFAKWAVNNQEVVI